MKSEKLHISESTDFNNLSISKDVFKLTCCWDTDNVEPFLWRLDSLVSSIVNDLKDLRVLDLSNLKGIKQFIFHGTSFMERLVNLSINCIYHYLLNL